MDNGERKLWKSLFNIPRPNDGLVPIRPLKYFGIDFPDPKFLIQNVIKI